MSGMCSTGHPWVDGVPTCSCDALGEPEGYVRFVVEPLPEERAKTVVTPHEPIRTPAPTLVAERPVLSEDGWWQWDGAQWVPAETPPVPPVPEQPPAVVTTATAPTAPVPEPAAEVPAPRPPADVPEWAAWSTTTAPAAPNAVAPTPPVVLGAAVLPTTTASRRRTAPVIGAVAVVAVLAAAGLFATGRFAHHASAQAATAAASTVESPLVRADLAAFAADEQTFAQTHGGFGSAAAVGFHPGGGRTLQARAGRDGFCAADGGADAAWLYDSTTATTTGPYPGLAAALSHCRAS